MKNLFLLGLIAVCFSCGGMILEKKQPKVSKAGPVVITTELREKDHYLKVLEAKYQAEGNTLNTAIVRGMSVELHQEYPSLTPIEGPASIESLRKNPHFLALEMTVEHLAQRESFKLGANHSAFHQSH